MKANKKNLISTVILLVIMSSCTAVISFYPLYTEDVLTRNDKIIGKWQTTDNYTSGSKEDTLVWEITLDKAVKIEGTTVEAKRYTYSLFLSHLSTPEIETEFKLHLIDLDGKTYIDFFPEELQPADNTIVASHLMGVHTFAKINFENDNITINWFDSEWFSKKLEKNKVRIKYEKNSAGTLLTAQPKELQKFVSKYSDDESAFKSGLEFTLKPLK